MLPTIGRRAFVAHGHGHARHRAGADRPDDEDDAGRHGREPGLRDLPALRRQPQGEERRHAGRAGLRRRPARQPDQRHDQPADRHRRLRRQHHRADGDGVPQGGRAGPAVPVPRPGDRRPRARRPGRRRAVQGVPGARHLRPVLGVVGLAPDQHPRRRTRCPSRRTWRASRSASSPAPSTPRPTSASAPSRSPSTSARPISRCRRARCRRSSCRSSPWWPTSSRKWSSTPTPATSSTTPAR